MDEIKKIDIHQHLIKGILAVIALVYILPLLLLFTNSFMSVNEINNNYSDTYPIYAKEHEEDSFHYAEYKMVPDRVSLEQYDLLLLKTPAYLQYFLNSIKITAPIVILQIIIGSFGGYAFAFSKGKYIDLVFIIYLIVMLLPYQATSVANFIMADKLHLLDTYWAIVLPMAFSPLPVFIMRQSMKTIDPEIIYAAKLEGAGNFRIFTSIILPMTKGGIISLFILSFCECWGMVEQAVIFISDSTKEPLSLFLSNIGHDNMGLVFAASVFYMLPAVWIFIYGIEYFEQGIMLSSIK